MRYSEFLRQRYRTILGYTGLLWVTIGLLILTPLSLLLVFQATAGVWWAFFLPGSGLVLLGLLVWGVLRPNNSDSLTPAEGAVIILLAWLMAILVGAVPFAWVNGLNLTQALFESTSGWTTTGLSVVEVDHASPLILFYRSLLQLAGGAGFAIIMLSALAGPVGPGLTIAEGRGEQLLPHVRQSAKLVLSIYTGYVSLGLIALRLAGMSWFDAVNHAFTALSTGGFSTHSASIGYWDSPAIEAVIIGLMLLGTLNFLTAYTLLRRKFRPVLRNDELRLGGVLIVLGVSGLFFGLTWQLYPTLSKAVRVAIFETVAAVSTTGFSTVTFENWSSFGVMLLMIFMLIGGGTGSTAGGIKQYRISVLLKGLGWELRRMLRPPHAVSEPAIWAGERRQFISETHLRQVGMFVFLYVIAFLAGSSVIAAYGYSFRESFFEFASALGTVGLSVGVTTPEAPLGVLWVEIAAMFLGRLEFLTVIVGGAKLVVDGPNLLRHCDRPESHLTAQKSQ